MRTLLIFASIMFLGGCVTSGSGLVIDSETNKSIANAIVVEKCYRSNGYHGSRHVRDVTKTSNMNGEFSFSISDVFGCGSAYFHASKEGYIETTGLHSGYHICGHGITQSCYNSVPKKIYLTKLTDENMVKLRALCSTNIKAFPLSSLKIPVPDRPEESRLYHGEYRVQYQNFIKAIEIAKTESEINYVKECHCNSLIDRFNKANPDDFKSLATSNINLNTHQLVADYCLDSN